MVTSQIYIIISIVTLALISMLVFFVKGKNKSKKLTPLAGLAFGFIIAGFFFGENKYTGYGLTGVGIILSIIDIILKFKEYGKNNNS